jgi:hypothetical protein
MDAQAQVFAGHRRNGERLERLILEDEQQFAGMETEVALGAVVLQFVDPLSALRAPE